MRTSILLAVFVLGGLAVNSQIVERAKDRAEEKTTNRVDNRIDQGIDKGLNAIEGLFKKKGNSDDRPATKSSENTEENGESSGFPGLFGGSADVEDAYNFEHHVSMTMESTEKKGKKTYVQDIDIYMSDEDPDLGIVTMTEDVKAVMVMDLEHLVMVSLMDQDGQKFGFATALNKDLLDSESYEDEDTPQFEKTGKTKTILGYSCDEYYSEDEEYTYNIWLTDELEFDIQKAFGGMSGMNKGPSPVSPGADKGIMMEMWSTKIKQPEEKVHILVTEINENTPFTISTSGYSFIGN